MEKAMKLVNQKHHEQHGEKPQQNFPRRFLHAP
jgi:hypothetical protein